MKLREIKFRAWSCHSMMFFDKPEDFKWFFGGSDGHERTLTSCELMQYTGLKDKNGKEIYEGDILSDSFGTKNPYVGPVEWSEDWAMFCVKHDKLESLIRWASVSEVIGNIYDNPDLLK